MDESVLHGSIHLNTRSPVSGTIWRGLGGVALLDSVTGSGLRGFKRLPPFPVVPFPLSCSSHYAHLLPLSYSGQSSLTQEKNTQRPELWQIGVVSLQIPEWGEPRTPSTDRQKTSQYRPCFRTPSRDNTDSAHSVLPPAVIVPSCSLLIGHLSSFFFIEVVKTIIKSILRRKGLFGLCILSYQPSRETQEATLGRN